MKKRFAVWMTMLALFAAVSAAPAAFAHCGMCGGDKDHDHATASLGEAVENKVAEKQDMVNTLEEAAAALEGSHPELAAKLQGYADQKKEYIEKMTA